MRKNLIRRGYKLAIFVTKYRILKTILHRLCIIYFKNLRYLFIQLSSIYECIKIKKIDKVKEIKKNAAVWARTHAKFDQADCAI